MTQNTIFPPDPEFDRLMKRGDYRRSWLGRFVLLLKLVTAFFVGMFLFGYFAFFTLHNWWDSDRYERDIVEQAMAAGYRIEVCHNEPACPQMRFIDLGPVDAPISVFVHGAMNRWTAIFDAAMNANIPATERLILVDRPGYGKSQRSQSEPSISAQADAFAPVVRSFGRPVRLIGYSYGGPIAATIAARQPDAVNRLFLLLPVLDPAYDVDLGRITQLDGWLARQLLPSPVFVALEEVRGHKDALRVVMPEWDTLTDTLPITVVNSTTDDLVPWQNAEFARAQWPWAQIRINTTLEHSVFWNQSHIVFPWLFDYA